MAHKSKKLGTLEKEFTYYDKRSKEEKVLAIPTLNTHEALQVCLCYLMTEG